MHLIFFPNVLESSCINSSFETLFLVRFFNTIFKLLNSGFFIDYKLTISVNFFKHSKIFWSSSNNLFFSQSHN